MAKAGAHSDEAPKKGGKKKLIIIVLALVVVLAVAAGALRFLAPGLVPGLGKKPSADAGTEGDAAGGESGEHATAEPTPPKSEDSHGGGGGGGAKGGGSMYPMKSFIVNLADPNGKRFLKLTLTLEMDRPTLLPAVEEKLPQITDAIIVLLSSMTFEDISTVEGKTKLRSQIVNRCNTFLTSGKIKNVYFSEFIVQ
ncbi:MAG: flagellar basal body-associated FliL family protein [Deltaproteobacteria bacterium]|nr:flagellar basal body-associated FliL family protein [Deltaproteobacteria bacterium]